MQGSISFSGKVAKWASLNGWLGTVQTVLLFRDVTISLQAASKLLPSGDDPVQTGGMAIGVYLLVTATAWLVERRPGRAA